MLQSEILQKAALLAPPQTVCVEDMGWLLASVMLLLVAVVAATVEKAVSASWAVPAFQRYSVMQHHSFLYIYNCGKVLGQLSNGSEHFEICTGDYCTLGRL